ncbi:MAG: hypothetical protein IIZ55_06395 [Firmicutes bacterium]|nr:hypothetical protein [Bacillota bacterium]
MKLNIAGYEVELTARGRYSDQARDEDTRYFLNQLSIWADEAAENLNRKGSDVLGRIAQDAGEDIYQELKATGFYDKAA